MLAANSVKTDAPCRIRTFGTHSGHVFGVPAFCLSGSLSPSFPPVPVVVFLRSSPLFLLCAPASFCLPLAACLPLGLLFVVSSPLALCWRTQFSFHVQDLFAVLYHCASNSSFSISCLFCSLLCPAEMLNHLGLTCHGSPFVSRRSSVVLCVVQ